MTELRHGARLSLEDTLEKFSLSDETRKKLIDGSCDAPEEFKEIAEVVLAGHFLVKGSVKERNMWICKETKVCPTCVEFYYHEESGDIKDFVVYHRNRIYKTRADEYMEPFALGVLHTHISGIDITFEKGNNAENAIRASMLIREFEIEGQSCQPDRRSKMVYGALFQQGSIFRGISVVWVDGEERADVAACPRKNVALYDDCGNKIIAKNHDGCIHTADNKYVQDLRKWQFKRKTAL